MKLLRLISKMATTRPLNSRGFSLIEVICVAGIMSILSLAIANMIVNQNRELKSIDEKMAQQNVQLLITNVLSSPTFCSCFMGTNTFNYTTSTWNTFPSSIGSSYDAACTSLGTPLLSVGSNIGNSNLLPSSMSMQNITETTAGSGNFTANLIVQLDSSLLVRSRKPITVPMYFKVNMAGVATARSLSSCASVSGSGTVDLATLCGQIGGVYNASATPPCQPTYQ